MKRLDEASDAQILSLVNNDFSEIPEAAPHRSIIDELYFCLQNEDLSQETLVRFALSFVEPELDFIDYAKKPSTFLDKRDHYDLNYLYQDEDFDAPDLSSDVQRWVNDCHAHPRFTDQSVWLGGKFNYVIGTPLYRPEEDDPSPSLQVAATVGFSVNHALEEIYIHQLQLSNTNEKPNRFLGEYLNRIDSEQLLYNLVEQLAIKHQIPHVFMLPSHRSNYGEVRSRTGHRHQTIYDRVARRNNFSLTDDREWQIKELGI